MRLAGRVAHNGVGRNAYRVLVAAPEGKSLLGRHRHRWEDNIQKKYERDGVDWIDLVQEDM
jgi:hypothetical protein